MIPTLVFSSVVLFLPAQAGGQAPSQLGPKSAAKVESAMTSDEALAKYNELKAKAPRTVAGQSKLAMWCEEHGLKAESLSTTPRSCGWTRGARRPVQARLQEIRQPVDDRCPDRRTRGAEEGRAALAPADEEDPQGYPRDQRCQEARPGEGGARCDHGPECDPVALSRVRRQRPDRPVDPDSGARSDRQAALHRGPGHAVDLRHFTGGPASGGGGPPRPSARGLPRGACRLDG